MASKNQAYLSSKEQEKGEITDKIESTLGSNLTQLDVEEIKKLKAFLKSVQDGNWLFSQQRNCLHSTSFSASKIDKNDIWFLHSGAIDHMTLDPNVFDTYEPIVTSTQITIANGTLVPIKGQGKVTLSLNLPIKRLLHVPNFSTNLVSIHQLRI